MRILAGGTLALLLFVNPEPSAQVRTTLDMTAPRPASPRDEALVSTFELPEVTGRSPHERPAPPALRLQIGWLDNSVYVYAAPFIMRIVVTNISRDPVTLPWTRDDGRMSATDLDHLEWTTGAFIGLELEMPDGGRMRIPLGSIYGLASDSSTVHTLKPGESAEILVSGRLTGYQDDEEAQFVGGRTVTIRPELDWLRPVERRRTGPVVSYPEVTSESATIQLFARNE